MNKLYYLNNYLKLFDISFNNKILFLWHLLLIVNLFFIKYSKLNIQFKCLLLSLHFTIRILNYSETHYHINNFIRIIIFKFNFFYYYTDFFEFLGYFWIFVCYLGFRYAIFSYNIWFIFHKCYLNYCYRNSNIYNILNMTFHFVIIIFLYTI